MAAMAAGSWVLVTGGVWDWQSPVRIGGEALHLRLDALSALFLVLVAVLGGAGALYAWEYWSDAGHPVSAPRGRFWWSALLLSMGLVLLSSNGLHFLIAWELFALAGFFLITLDSRNPEVRGAGWLYLAASHAGTLMLFAFFALLAARTGSWELGPMRDQAGLGSLFWLALLGFGVKAGLFPLHIWLPSAHANAPSHVSAILSGVAIKLGIYGIVRFSGWLPVPVAAGWLVAVLGVVSAVLGVVFALGQHELKRLLAYHSVENIGIILIGVGFAMVAAARDHAAWGVLALAGGLLHVWNHGLFKSLLFLGAGSVVHATGTREMSRLGGLWRAMPWTASMFALGAVAISGLPPLNGFVSEWLVYLGLFDAVHDPGATLWAAIPAIVLLAMTGALALACFVKVCGVVFLGAPRSEGAVQAHECGRWMRAPMLALALGCAGIGLAPMAFWPALRSTVGAWHGAWASAPAPQSLGTLGMIHLALVLSAVGGGIWLWRQISRGGLVRGLTWDCGYAAPTARMQYTAGSFAGIITEWFAWILQPVRRAARPEGTFPGHARIEEHTPETVLERVVEPVARLVIRGSGMVRRLQNGRAQAYLFYLILGLAAVAAMTLAWSEPELLHGGGE
ncbi:MAG: NADH-quinone oxidoreductase subunit H [Verrucomicrobia bacterium]|nr:NADH-quinone oxidoreductase subunit H [Verrucomicrobiota bacterium]